MSHAVSIQNAVKRYGDFTAVDGVSLDIEPGEFFTLLGPSGCGKTTLLRMIAGFNTIEGGDIFFNEQRINNIEAHKRDIGMVFQNYAIFPHLTVEDNVAYGLKARKVPNRELEERVMEALELVQISSLKERRPNELSGGQQQRVALSRAFVIEPGLLLMDEPLSNLDAKLRVEMRLVIKQLQRSLGITTIYVTHDQEEALAISDRIAVMNKGKIVQVGSPAEIYLHPQDPFIAGFIGTSNFLDVEVRKLSNVFAETEESGYLHDTLLPGGATVPMSLNRNYEGASTLSIRPEQLYIADEVDGQAMPGIIEYSVFLGDYTEYVIRLENGDTLQMNEYTKDTEDIRTDGEQVHVKFNPKNVILFDTEGEVISC